MPNRNCDLRYKIFSLFIAFFKNFSRIQLIFLGIFIIIFMTNCKNDEKKLLIPEEKLIAILTDIHLAEAALKNVKKDKKDSLGALYYDQVFTIHNVSREQFETDLDNLRSSPKRIAEVYDKILEQLNKKGKHKEITSPK